LKKLIAGLFGMLFALTMLCSCREASRSGFFSYQDTLSETVIFVESDKGEYRIRLTFEDGDDGRECKKAEYLSPKEISGLVFRKKGDEITAEYNGLNVTAAHFDKEEIFAVSELFFLESADITHIRSRNGNSIADGNSGELLWTVITDKNGTPLEIRSSGKLNCTVKIESLK